MRMKKKNKEKYVSDSKVKKRKSTTPGVEAWPKGGLPHLSKEKASVSFDRDVTD